MDQGDDGAVPNVTIAPDDWTAAVDGVNEGDLVDVDEAGEGRIVRTDKEERELGDSHIQVALEEGIINNDEARILRDLTPKPGNPAWHRTEDIIEGIKHARENYDYIMTRYEDMVREFRIPLSRQELLDWFYLKGRRMWEWYTEDLEQYLSVIERIEREHQEDKVWARDYIDALNPITSSTYRRLHQIVETSLLRGERYTDEIRRLVAPIRRDLDLRHEEVLAQAKEAATIISNRQREYGRVCYKEVNKKGRGKPSFEDELLKIKFKPATYLKDVSKKAKAFGYDPSSIRFATDGVHKLEIATPTGRIVRFGRVGYGDFLIWSLFEKRGDAESGTAFDKRRTFHASHSKIRGNWKSNDFSPNNLALRLLW